MERTNSDIGRTGMIGEENNRLLMYMVLTSRLGNNRCTFVSLGRIGNGQNAPSGEFWN